MIKNNMQPNCIEIDKKIRIVKTDRSRWREAYKWYQNEKIMYYSEGVKGKTYDLQVIEKMYSYLSNIGELYFIEIYENETWISIGDVTLSSENFPIVIGDEKYWGLGIGKKVIEVLINRAREIKMESITIPEIYKYNDRSKALFVSLGFKKIDENEKSEKFKLIL